MTEKISIYQVLPRLFGNQNKKPIPNGNIHENGCGKFNDFTPQALEKTRNLGINYIWYTGIIRHATTTNYPKLKSQDQCIVKGKAGSPYAITDYYDVNPDLAVDVSQRMKEFEELIERTNAAGMKTIIDFIPNHVSRDYNSLNKPKGIQDLGETDNKNQSFNPQNNFYYLPGEDLKLDFCEQQKYIENPAKFSGNDCFHAHPQITDWYETIKLNYGVDVQNHYQQHFSPIPNTWERMLEILKFWTAKNIHGFRCDMVEMVPVEFWAWAIPQVKSINPEILFIGEVYQPQLYEAYIKEGKFDYLYDKVGLYDQLKAVLRGEKPAGTLSDSWKSLQGLDEYMLRFLENHDEQRIPSSYFAGQAEKAIPAMLLSATMHNGPIMTYFGQEFGEAAQGSTGFSGDDSRTTIFDYWNVETIQKWRGKSAYSGSGLNSSQKLLQKEYQKILKLSINNPIIANGEFYDLTWANRYNHHFYHNHVFAYFRSFEKKCLLFILNFSDKTLEQKVIIPGHALEFAQKDTTKLKDQVFKNVFSKENIKLPYYTMVNDGISVNLKPYYYQVFEF
ncbi:alpha-amylase family protein [Lentimicrobium sp. S6]|uniref:alpha-amylase family protein n=1 Tax=Lentimicrobium sp. S6 TaxID=2735872 RepID=UPI001555739F|nr:alpha-amylase family protein [Lentimicrobium sp. S6]NPD46777.1 alpha-amylase [Lentimicrobium sp. S6]